MSAAGRFNQIWNSSSGLGAVGVHQGEHLGVHDAAAGREPLRVAPAEAGGGAEGVGVVDQAAAHERDRLEAAVRVAGEAGDDLAVVHAPAVDAGEVGAEVAALEVGLRTEVVVAGGVVVDVVDTEEEGIDHRPLGPEGEGVLDQVLSVGHGSTVTVTPLWLDRCSSIAHFPVSEFEVPGEV